MWLCLPPPAVLPYFLADQAGHPWLSLGGRNDPMLRCRSCDLKRELGPDRLLEPLAILDRDHERARTADDAVLVIEIEIIDIHGRIGRLLDHDRQPIDDDAYGRRRRAFAISGDGPNNNGVPENVDDASRAPIG